MEENRTLEELEERIGYHFQDKNLLRHAMIHSSFSNEKHMEKEKNNERLEFLGDAVLELVSSNFLYHKYPENPEGDLTRIRASIVCEPTLALCAREIELGQFLLLGKGEDLTGGRGRDSITSDAMEALIGAVFLDGGLASAKEFIDGFILNDVEHKQLFYDSKTILQEVVQGMSEEPLIYNLVGEEGPEHDKKFFVQVIVEGKCLGEGSGRTKKAAQQMAAYQAILKLDHKTEKGMKGSDECI